MTAQEIAQRNIQRVYRVQEKYCERLMQLPHVVGVGIGYAKQHGERTSETALIVMVDHKLPENQLSPEQRIPRYLDGVRVDVQEVGAFVAH